MVQTTTIETVTVVRPLKVIALVCCCISIVLLIIALSTHGWLEADGYKQGLWKYCTWTDDESTECFSNVPTGWIKACAALCIIGLLATCGGAVLTALGLFSAQPQRKQLCYRIALGLVLAAIVCVVISVVVFPIMFMQHIAEMNKPKWYFAWSYGLAWGAAIFLCGVAVLLFMDKENDEIYYKEKTTYNSGYETDA